MNRCLEILPVEGLPEQTGLLLAMLDAGTQEWRGELGQVSKEALIWQPLPGAHSIGAILLHIADVEAFWLHEIAAGQKRAPEALKTLLSEETDQYACRWPTPPRRPLAWYYAQMDAVRQQTREFVRTLNDPVRRSRVGRNEEATLRWLLHHVLVHEAYHSGQTVLLALQHRAAVRSGTLTRSAD